MKNINRKEFLILKLVIIILIFLFTFTLVAAYPMPTAVIGELSGEGASNAYVYITAYNQEDASTIYYNSLQSDSEGRFLDIIALDQGIEFTLKVQLLPQGANLDNDIVTYSFNNLNIGNDQYIDHVFVEQDPVTDDSDHEIPSSSSSGGGGNSVGKVIEVPDIDEIIGPDMSSSPLNEEQEEELLNLIDSGKSSNNNNNNNLDKVIDSDDKEPSYSVLDKLIAPIQEFDPVALMLLSSMVMIFGTIIILLVLPERYDSSEEEEKKAKNQIDKPIKERELSLKGKGNFTGDLDLQTEVNDLKENDFVFIGGKKK